MTDWREREPFKSEGDNKAWRHAGLACEIVRHPRMGHLCGYVGVPEGHPAWGKDYDHVAVDAHGGLTFADRAEGYLGAERQPGEVLWWLGFDCAHAGDGVPGMMIMPFWDRRGGSYRDLTFVTRETNRLAEQLAAMSARAKGE